MALAVMPCRSIAKERGQLPRGDERRPHRAVIAANDGALGLVQRHIGVVMVIERGLRAVGELLAQHQAADVVKQSRHEKPLGVAFAAKTGNRTRCQPARKAV
jgi:hypothetical protein